MYVVCVTVNVKPGVEDAFLAATKLNHQGSINEPGCARFDVLRSTESPSQFFLYEVYDDQAAFAAHQQTAHYVTWRDTVNEMMAERRKGVKYTSLFPADEDFR